MPLQRAVRSAYVSTVNFWVKNTSLLLLFFFSVEHLFNLGWKRWITLSAVICPICRWLQSEADQADSFELTITANTDYMAAKQVADNSSSHGSMYWQDRWGQMLAWAGIYNNMWSMLTYVRQWHVLNAFVQLLSAHTIKRQSRFPQVTWEVSAP